MRKWCVEGIYREGMVAYVQILKTTMIMLGDENMWKVGLQKNMRNEGHIGNKQASNQNTEEKKKILVTLKRE